MSIKMVPAFSVELVLGFAEKATRIKMEK